MSVFEVLQTDVLKIEMPRSLMSDRSEERRVGKEC